MADKNETELSIVLRTVDRATAGIRAVNKQLDEATRPIRDFRKALGELRDKSGLDDVIGGFKGVGSAVMGVLGMLAMVGGLVAGAVVGLFSLVDGFDALGDKAEAAGVSVDFLAQMRFAAEKSGASADQLDASLQTLSVSLGMVRAGGGKMTAFLKEVSPALLKQLKNAKDNEAAFNLLAGAMVKITDPAKRAAFAQKTLGDASLAPLLFKGAKGIKALREEYFKSAGSMEAAAKAAGETDDALKTLKASTDGVKAALVQGLAPALTIVVGQLSEWFTSHREDIKQWALDVGEKLPGAVDAVVKAVKGALDDVGDFVDAIGGWKVAAVALGVVLAGPLISSILALGVALLTTPVGWIVAGIAAIAAGAYLIIKNWDAVSAFFVEMWDEIIAPLAPVIALMMPFIGIPLLIIKHWGGIKEFFAGLWGAVTAVFEKAWAIIKGIVDAVVGAVKTVVDAIGSITKSIDVEGIRAKLVADKQAADLTARAQGVVAAQAGSTEARVKIDIGNAPRGTRANTDPQSTADVDLSVGYQMGFGS